jgi:hypothetical protein
MENDSSAPVASLIGVDGECESLSSRDRRRASGGVSDERDEAFDDDAVGDDDE